MTEHKIIHRCSLANHVVIVHIGVILCAVACRSIHYVTHSVIKCALILKDSGLRADGSKTGLNLRNHCTQFVRYASGKAAYSSSSSDARVTFPPSTESRKKSPPHLAGVQCSYACFIAAAETKMDKKRPHFDHVVFSMLI